MSALVASPPGWAGVKERVGVSVISPTHTTPPSVSAARPTSKHDLTGFFFCNRRSRPVQRGTTERRRGWAGGDSAVHNPARKHRVFSVFVLTKRDRRLTSSHVKAGWQQWFREPAVPESHAVMSGLAQGEVDRQIQQMVAFIEQEAKEKADEIAVKVGPATRTVVRFLAPCASGPDSPLRQEPPHPLAIYCRPV